MTEQYFKPFREQIIGINQTYPSPQGQQNMIYADWIASGRLYAPIERMMRETLAPFCANTHTETSITGTLMTRAYRESKSYIKRELNASDDDVLIFSGSGMTASINKLQRILGLRIPENAKKYLTPFQQVEPDLRPVVFITHLEHHSNHTSWLETLADVEIINPDANGEVDLDHLAALLKQYQHRPLKIASVSACSNVTGIFTPYYTIAEMLHASGGYCFVDFACSGPYVEINMHPENPAQQLDAVFVSPHKFLGGPGTPGVMVFNKALYHNTIPDHSGGGTVRFTTPWKFHEYIQSIEDREDGGTPPFMQGIRAALCFKLKKEMGAENMLKREEAMLEKAFDRLTKIPNLHILAENIRKRIGCISFYIDDLHFNLGVKLLNDYFGVQVRGGCACAGTYGHYLLNITREQSDHIIERLHQGELFMRPGWIRLSLHPTHTDAELETILRGIEYVAANHLELAKAYTYDTRKNIYHCTDHDGDFEEDYLNKIYSEKF